MTTAFGILSMRRAWLIAALAVGPVSGCAGRSREPSSPTTIARRRILYTSQAPGGTEDLRMLDPQSGASTLVLSGDSISSRSLAAWSPDARRIALVREYGTRDELYILDSKSGVARRLGNDLPNAILFPDWSPNGTRLVVSTGDEASHPGVSIIEVATGQSRQLRRDAASYRCPSWSPRGDRLVVAAYAAGSSALLILDTLGVVLDTLIRSDTTYLDCPQWSPRGDEVLFTIFHGGGRSGWERAAFNSNLAIVSLESRTVAQLTRDAGLTNYGRWARDGEWIVFQSDRHATPTTDPARVGQMLQNLEIWVIRRDGTGARRLTMNGHFDAHPSW